MSGVSIIGTGNSRDRHGADRCPDAPHERAITERWVKTLRAELLDCTLIWNQTHLQHALREYLPRAHSAR